MASDEDILKILNEKDKKNRKWLDIISDLFWPISHWPKHIIKNLFCCEYVDRLSLTSFLYKNGFPPAYFLDFVAFYASPSKRGTSWETRKKELQSLWLLCENITQNGSIEQRKKYFFFSMNDKLVYNYANQIKYYGNTHPSEKFQHNTIIQKKVKKLEEEGSERKPSKRKHLTLPDFENMTEDIFREREHERLGKKMKENSLIKLTNSEESTKIYNTL